MTNRIAEIRALISPRGQRGMEIGPLDKPIVNAAEGDISYTDYLSRDQLRQKYKDDPNVNCDNIVEITYLWGDRTLAEAVGETSCLDYVIASHVIEHVPDLIGWLQEVAEVLKPGGVVSLAIPDKRYCFDYLRNLSTPGDAVEAYLIHKRCPSVRHIFDHYFSAVMVDTNSAWAGKINSNCLLHYSTITDAWRLAERAQAGEYIDAHVWVFTADSFVHLIDVFGQLNLINLTLVRFTATQPGTLEFFVTLQKATS